MRVTYVRSSREQDIYRNSTPFPNSSVLPAFTVLYIVRYRVYRVPRINTILRFSIYDRISVIRHDKSILGDESERRVAEGLNEPGKEDERIKQGEVHERVNEAIIEGKL